jgi:hypothetical protein
MESHRAQVVVKLAELQENLKLIDHKIDVYSSRVAAGDADQTLGNHAEASAAALDDALISVDGVSRKRNSLRSTSAATSLCGWPSRGSMCVLPGRSSHPTISAARDFVPARTTRRCRGTPRRAPESPSARRRKYGRSTLWRPGRESLSRPCRRRRGP